MLFKQRYIDHRHYSRLISLSNHVWWGFEEVQYAKPDEYPRSMMMFFCWWAMLFEQLQKVIVVEMAQPVCELGELLAALRKQETPPDDWKPVIAALVKLRESVPDAPVNPLDGSLCDSERTILNFLLTESDPATAELTWNDMDELVADIRLQAAYLKEPIILYVPIEEEEDT